MRCRCFVQMSHNCAIAVLICSGIKSTTAAIYILSVNLNYLTLLVVIGRRRYKDSAIRYIVFGTRIVPNISMVTVGQIESVVDLSIQRIIWMQSDVIVTMA